ncbi:hypothetical protein ACFWVF_00925 [Streptomyces sp. NPDC058659]|uniref:hypothetical protein n=1 Tax=unclassified Streptomyces TaxID=2593676 RepID=UPI003662692D
MSLLNGGTLQAVHGGPLFLALFSLGWVATLGLLALVAGLFTTGVAGRLLLSRANAGQRGGPRLRP